MMSLVGEDPQKKLLRYTARGSLPGDVLVTKSSNCHYTVISARASKRILTNCAPHDTLFDITVLYFKDGHMYIHTDWYYPDLPISWVYQVFRDGRVYKTIREY